MRPTACASTCALLRPIDVGDVPESVTLNDAAAGSEPLSAGVACEARTSIALVVTDVS